MLVKTKKELIKSLNEVKPFLIQNYGLKTLGIFGSFSRDTITPESDIDLLVDISEAKFDYMAGMQNYLETKLGRPVDLVRKRRGLRKSFFERIQKELIDV